ncbi:MAG: glucosidase [Flavobacteriales bacterium]|nr:glucosidase [Flavobacteriales bacterium]
MKLIEERRLEELDQKGKQTWRKWGPYLSERQWGTVREDYSENGAAWSYFPHDHARSRVYRWGEDGIAGISDEHQNLCFSLGMWNGNDSILKERLYGLTGEDGNHGEDVKELYYYLDNTPSHSYMKYLYKYPHQKFPYGDLLRESKKRTKTDREYEVLDTGVFDDNKYFDVFIEYAKEGPFDILIKITAFNRGKDSSDLTMLPNFWFRNLWDFGVVDKVPSITKEETEGFGGVKAAHHRIGDYYLYFDSPDKFLFTNNTTNSERIFDTKNESPFVKDAFHTAIVKNKDLSIFDGVVSGTKFAPYYYREVKGGEKVEFRLKLTKDKTDKNPLLEDFTETFKDRVVEADKFYDYFIPKNATEDMAKIQRQAFAGMLWTKQYYNFDVQQWLDGDKGHPIPPKSRQDGRNSGWRHLHNEDIMSMPDKWEYPWYAAWDTAFHCVPIAMIDPDYAKKQLIILTREWYMHPNGQMPAYEWAFGDVNPPVQAWAALKVFETEKKHFGRSDVDFLKKIFQKLSINFTWWVNQKDSTGKNVFEGGFLGLDNIGVFDRSNKLPGGGVLEQADGTAWMAMYSLNLMKMAIKICEFDRSFEDVATKFYEHFVYIAESLNKSDNKWVGMWDEEEGFFYDLLMLPDEKCIPLKIHSLVGLMPMYAVSLIHKETLANIPDFMKRLRWFRNNRTNKEKYLVVEDFQDNEDVLFSLIPKERLIRLLQHMLDESEFLSKGGVRSLSKRHTEKYSVSIQDEDYDIDYQPGESTTSMFGGNSNWRGPVWFPTNYLLIESLREYHKYYGDDLKLEFPSKSGNKLNLDQIADELSNRLISIFTKDNKGNRLSNEGEKFYRDPHCKELVLFYEYFHGDNLRGVGASHQTGWTGIVAKLINKYKG